MRTLYHTTLHYAILPTWSGQSVSQSVSLAFRYAAALLLQRGIRSETCWCVCAAMRCPRCAGAAIRKDYTPGLACAKLNKTFGKGVRNGGGSQLAG